MSKKPFLAGLLIALITFSTIIGGFGAVQNRAAAQSLSTRSDIFSDYVNLSSSSGASDNSNRTSQPVCPQIIMNVVAHQDDDLLFMNPDLLHDVQAGDCIRTVYVTAGDAGSDQQYWLNREQGAEAAYASMLGQPTTWQVSRIKVGNRFWLNTASPQNNPNVSLTFIRLPDGNLNGQGFAATNFESLQKLENGTITSVQAVDGSNSYTIGDLVYLMSDLINQYQPDFIRTQANDTPDHSDHVSVGRLAKQAYELYNSQNISIKPIILNYYSGYAIYKQPVNVSNSDLVQKQDAFLQYAKFDGAVCNNLDQCNTTSTYGSYLNRQYQSQ